MRDKNRIKRILKLIEEIWINNADQRFGQLLINLGIVSDDFNTWQTEDDILEKRLIKIKNG
ncbi:MAG: hypothetical protein KKF50_01275 [Nanoarchaeota archaeon]|nr:hypothetical protein [Nanoarchaeota archaeon]